uniref:DNA ligase n=1 Tax=Litopenaeus vannamei majanivirus Nimav-1_LVa TaxID=2984273 RepID=A0A9C7C5J0_9VIRU|nr:MAG: DNA ligase 3-like protein [Litopenaeus vannamei majanivirus Nimav-1_LVa]
MSTTHSQTRTSTTTTSSDDEDHNTEPFVEPPVIAKAVSENTAESETTSLPYKSETTITLTPSVIKGTLFCADYSPKRGTAKCKRCSETCEKGKLRIGKKVRNFFSNDCDVMTYWYHAHCIFESFRNARPTTIKIKEPAVDIKGWEKLLEEDKNNILAMVRSASKSEEDKNNILAMVRSASKSNHQQPRLSKNVQCYNRLFSTFCDLCNSIAKEPSYREKTRIVSDLLLTLSIEDLGLWIRLLLPCELRRIYNIKSKQLVKLFGQLFGESVEEMTRDLDMSGDVADTITRFYCKRYSANHSPKITLREVDQILANLEGKTKETEQLAILHSVVYKNLPPKEFMMIVRLIECNLRINAGPKHILDGVHKDAYAIFQTTRDIDMVLSKVMKNPSSSFGSSVSASAVVLIPVKPMLAERCKSVSHAFRKCGNQTIYSEIKYDGERVQIHRKGTITKYFTRSLKPVNEHKIKQFDKYIPMAFPESDEYILDAELVMMDNETGMPLPFGTLGRKEMEKHENANPCLFVFDLLLYNGEDLMKMKMCERRRMLEENMVKQKNRIMLSEMVKIEQPSELEDMISRVLGDGLEGLVLKKANGEYEPGKRHWLKIKKDSIYGGAMADTLDLVVLGSWYGTGKNKGKLSVFLMGCYDKRSEAWRTVAKVHTGHTDATLNRLQGQLMSNMMRYNDAFNSIGLNYNLKLDKNMKPDFVVIDPKRSPVWEIIGAEITKQENQNHHTAHGISIRFPRVKCERDDKTWETATSMQELMHLYDISVSVNKRKTEEKKEAVLEAKRKRLGNRYDLM